MTSQRSLPAAVLVLAIFAVGCASTGGPAPAVPISQADLERMAGKWRGWWTDAAGSAVALEIQANPDGTYVSQSGTRSGGGTFKMVDGKIVTTGYLAGPDAPLSGRTSVVTLTERGGRQVLVGRGETNAGPFSFELTKE